MEKISNKIIPMVTDADEASCIVLETIDDIILRQNKIVTILKELAKTAPANVEALDAIEELE